MAHTRAAVFLVFGLLAPHQSVHALVLGDFETEAWPGLEQSTEQVKAGRFSGKWADLKSHATLAIPNAPTNWSTFDRLTFWLYSATANRQRLTLVCNSENKTDESGWDYFYYHFTVDWIGWKLFDLRLGPDIRPTRRPVGWHEVTSVSFHSSGWQHKPLPDTVLYFDDVRLVRAPLRLVAETSESLRTPAGDVLVTWRLAVTNRSDQACRVELAAGDAVAARSGAQPFHLAEIPASVGPIPPGDTQQVSVVLRAAAADVSTATPLTGVRFPVEARRVPPAPEAGPAPTVTVSAAVPLPARTHPFLFGDAALFRRALARAERHDWARKQVDSLISQADAVADADLVVPEDPGQWSHHYVCKACGSRLKHAEGEHKCRACDAEYTGWPYDQVIAAWAHSRNWRNVRTLGLGYALTGDEAYARKAREVLLAYAERYPDFPLHNVRGRLSRSAARVFAQTLDESVSIIGVAWGYDLVYDSPCFTRADRERIETRFLREVVRTVRRNDAGISNWQSWHNAGIAAVGFCLQDAEIAAQALYGKSGLAFQLENSVLADGFWYEGTAAYHYYALDALRWTVEAAHHAGIDFQKSPSYRALFNAPLYYVFPDLRFPAVNDSDVFSVKGRHGLYELAFARLGDPAALTVARHGNRTSLEALLWGAEDLPEAPDWGLESRDFKGLGAAVLRQGRGERQLYAHLDYGPHGGGHGHPDKLTLILFGLGRQLAPDPGRLAYGAPLQGSWYRQTFAHNTVCIDESSQARTTGELLLFHSEPGLAAAQARCDTAYPSVRMLRTLLLTPSYLVDVFDVQSDTEHVIDWLYHNVGELRMGVPTDELGGPLGEKSGYQYMKDVRKAARDGPWSAEFRQPAEAGTVRLTVLGGASTEVYAGTGMMSNPPKPCPMLVARRRAKSARFVAVVEPWLEAPRVSEAEILRGAGGGDLELRLTVDGRPVHALVAEQGSEAPNVAGRRTNARVCLAVTEPAGEMRLLEAPATP